MKVTLFYYSLCLVNASGAFSANNMKKQDYMDVSLLIIDILSISISI